MKAFLKNNRQAPRKVRVLANVVRGRNVAQALAQLEHMPQKGAATLRKLILSAVANARQDDAALDPAALKVKAITVDKGMTFVRYMPRAFGRATPINRESSHIRIQLEKIEDTFKDQAAKPQRTVRTQKSVAIPAESKTAQSPTKKRTANATK